jgi:predicted nucleic acid-binding protein
VSVYVESSAALAWLLDEEAGAEVRRLLAAQDFVIASDLTLIECDRVLLRAVVVGELSEGEAAGRRAHLAEVSSHWQILRISPEIADRARRPFANEPIRTLDAIHLASALVARAAVPELKLLSLDERVRRAGRAMGLELLPA